MNDLVQYRQRELSPEANTSGLEASLKPVVRSLLCDPVHRDFQDEFGWDGYVNGYHLPVQIEATEDDLQEALSHSEQFMKPLPDDQIVLEINKLKVRCKMRAEQQEDLQMLIACMIDDLSEYPGDIALDVLRQWPKLSPWWPSWNELYELLERKTQPRRAIRSAIKRSLGKVTGDEPKRIQSSRKQARDRQMRM